jgi:nucleoside-diphosphate-sugar epimerase
VLCVDDLAQPASARDAADNVDAVIHAASVFRTCHDMEFQLVQPNLELAEQMVCACAASNARLVLTSSMAAVRGTAQTPTQGTAYTSADWNSVSMRDGKGFEPYQYSKAESERRAWVLSKRLGAEMVSICPSMIFGPPRTSRCREGFSVQMVRRWIDGEAPVQSRLVVDVRDCAQAHINAALLDVAAGKRYIASCEARVPAAEVAEILKERIRASGLGNEQMIAKIAADEQYDGGAIPIGEQEVVAAQGMAELGVACRSTTETLADMAEALLVADM